MNGSNDGPSIFDSIFGKGKPILCYRNPGYIQEIVCAPLIGE